MLTALSTALFSFRPANTPRPMERGTAMIRATRASINEFFNLAVTTGRIPDLVLKDFPQSPVIRLLSQLKY